MRSVIATSTPTYVKWIFGREIFERVCPRWAVLSARRSAGRMVRSVRESDSKGHHVCIEWSAMVASQIRSYRGVGGRERKTP